MSVRCRSCLSNKKQRCISLLVVLSEFGNNSILDLLNVVTSSKIYYSKDLPGQICADCLEKLKNAYSFITQFKRNQKEFQDNSQSNTNKDIKNIKIEVAVKQEDENIRDILNSANTEIILLVNEDGTIYDQSDDEDYNVESPDTNDQHDEQIQSLKDELENDLNSEAEIEESDPVDIKEEVVGGLKIVTLEDVMKSDRQKLSEKKKIMSVEDVLNAAKPKNKIKEEYDDEETLSCSFCQKIFTSLRSLRLHKFSIHNPNWETKYKCEVCGVQLRTLSQHKHHLTKHQNLRFACDHFQCDKAYLTKAKLKEHVRNKHETTLDNKYLCTKCGRGFKYSHALSYHMKIHTNSRNYVCRYCGHASRALSGLKRHERTHTGERPYECKYCKKTFAGAAEKKKHELNHEGVFNYKCVYCGKRYVQPYNMKVHWMQHRGSYECEVCKRGYVDAEVLKFHYAHSHKIKDVVIEEVEVDSEHGEMDDLSQ